MNDRIHRLFREKSVEDISSPDEMDDYICVVRSGFGFVVAGIFLLAICAGIWIKYGI